MLKRFRPVAYINNTGSSCLSIALSFSLATWSACSNVWSKLLPHCCRTRTNALSYTIYVTHHGNHSCSLWFSVKPATDAVKEPPISPWILRGSDHLPTVQCPRSLLRPVPSYLRCINSVHLRVGFSLFSAFLLKFILPGILPSILSHLYHLGVDSSWRASAETAQLPHWSLVIHWIQRLIVTLTSPRCDLLSSFRWSPLSLYIYLYAYLTKSFLAPLHRVKNRCVKLITQITNTFSKLMILIYWYYKYLDCQIYLIRN